MTASPQRAGRLARWSTLTGFFGELTADLGRVQFAQIGSFFREHLLKHAPPN